MNPEYIGRRIKSFPFKSEDAAKRLQLFWTNMRVETAVVKRSFPHGEEWHVTTKGKIPRDFEKVSIAAASAILSYESPHRQEIAKVQRINITMPKWLMKTTDQFAEEKGEIRSGLIAKALMKYMGDSIEDEES